MKVRDRVYDGLGEGTSNFEVIRIFLNIYLMYNKYLSHN